MVQQFLQGQFEVSVPVEVLADVSIVPKLRRRDGKRDAPWPGDFCSAHAENIDDNFLAVLVDSNHIPPPLSFAAPPSLFLNQLLAVLTLPSFAVDRFTLPSQAWISHLGFGDECR